MNTHSNMLFRQVALSAVLVLLCSSDLAAVKGGCPFVRVRPIPDGKALVYLYKAPYGKQVYPIVVNGSVITYLQRAGYFPLVTPPGKLELFMGAGDARASGFFSTPTLVLEVESGKEYYVELTTRFDARLNVHSQEKGLEKLRDDRLLLPYTKYMQEISSGRHSIRYVVERFGFAQDCTDTGIVSGTLTAGVSAASPQERSTTLDDEGAGASVWIYACCRSLSRPSIFVDGIEIARLEQNRFMNFRLPPGQHEFDVDRRGNDSKTVHLKPGTTTCLKVEFGWAKTRLKLVSEKQKIRESKGFAQVQGFRGQILFPAETAAKPQLTITSEPSGAQIEIDGEFIGNTPTTMTSKEGSVSVTIKKAGFQDWEQTLKLNPGDKRTVHAEMVK